MESPTDQTSLAIVEAVAALEGTEPAELSPPLYSVIDPEALDSLFRSPAGETPKTEGEVRFTFSGHDIAVRSDGEITVRKE